MATYYKTAGIKRPNAVKLARLDKYAEDNEDRRYARGSGSAQYL